ncbi:hypothetical protein R0K05_15955 [Planococcus sp. SIMBA_160]
MEATKIIEVMDKLDDLPYQKILFDGPWGIGKTIHTMDSIKDKENVYYISLFGKKNIDDFYQELYYLLLSKHQVKFKKILNSMKNINVSHFGFNISIPLISDIFIDIQKQLKIKSNIKIIIDDIERKNEDFNIKEVFGFIDSITKNKGIKIILVASSENFLNQEKIRFGEYAEKSIDRIYKITTYSNDAPKKIMGNTIWPLVKEIYEDNERKNLRTLEKADQFIKEVIQEIPNNEFTAKFNREDIYKICFSVVIFVVDHNCKTDVSADKESEKVSNPKEFTSHIWHSILNQSLNNSMMYDLIPIILEWFLTGDYSRTQFEELVRQVDKYVESTYPLFMSDEQIEKEIENFSTFIENLDNDLSIKSFLQRLDELANIAEKTNLDFKYDVNEVVDWINNINNFSNKYNDTYFEDFRERKSSFINEVILKLQTITQDNYRNYLLKAMIENVNKQNFTPNDVEVVTKFRKIIHGLKEESLKERENIKKEMVNNKWFLPLPLGGITHSQWTYCHSIFKCIQELAYGEEVIIEDAIKYFNQEIDNYPDEIFKYRLRHLIKQYLDVV